MPFHLLNTEAQGVVFLPSMISYSVGMPGASMEVSMLLAHKADVQFVLRIGYLISFSSFKLKAKPKMATLNLPRIFTMRYAATIKVVCDVLRSRMCLLMSRSERVGGAMPSIEST